MGYAVIFQLLAANRPATGQFEDAPAAPAPEAAKKEKKAVEWGIFSVPAAQVCKHVPCTIMIIEHDH